MENPKVSVVIPIYNVERYLRQCLDSVITQTLKDIEIICVDDGSPDNCGAIIDEYAQKDNRIVAIHKENGGYGSAINYGFSIAKGEYVGIVESDDWIAPNMYELLYNKAIQTGSEIVKGAFWNVEDSVNDKKSISKFVVNLYNRHETFTLEEDPEILSYFASIWSSVYKRDWLQKYNIKMVEDIKPYEDMPFLAEVFAHANQISLLPTPVYFYRKDAVNSSCNTVKRTIVNYIPQRARVRDIFINNNKYSENLKEYYWRIAYLGAMDFYNKPNNKFRKEFFYRMKNLFKHYIEDHCELKYLNEHHKKDFINVINMSYELYSFNLFIKKVLQFIFSITNSERHKVITIFGIKLKIGRRITKCGYLFKMLDCILPKNSRKIVFCGFPDFSDNAREYYEYMKANHSDEYELVWLYTDSKNRNYPFIENKYSANSFKGIMQLLTAKYFVYTGLYLNNLCTLKKHVFLQLWHGMPLKTLGFTEKDIDQKFYDQYQDHAQSGHFFVSSDIFKLSMIASFLMNPNRVHITGQSKTDCILSKRNNAQIREFINYDKYSKVIIYSPTYKEAERNNRRDIDKEFNNIFYCDDYSQDNFYKMLEDKNILFIVKPHPFDENFYRQYMEAGGLNHPNIKVVFDNDMKENNFYFYEFFQFADLMITDFSSIGIDYLITKKPIIFLSSTAEEYSHKRGLILEDNYKILMPGQKVVTFTELLSAIEDSLTVDSWKNKRLELLPLLYKYFDSKSSERIYDIMKTL